MKLLLLLLALPMIGFGQNNLFVNIVQNQAEICAGDSIILIAIDSSYTPSIGYNGPSWHVCQTGSDIHGDGSLTNPFFSIQTAVDSASAGDSIFVAPGIYYESIFIYDKDLFLLGSGIQQTIIDAQNQDYGIKMYGANVPDNSVIHIEGFTIINAGNGQGQGAGIFLNGNSNGFNTFIYATILSCEIAFCNIGINITNERGISTIKNNILHNSLRGLSTGYGTYYIENNTIVKNRCGYQGSSGNIGGRYLKNNIIANNTEYGISEHYTTPIYSSFNNIWGNGSGSWSNPPTSSVSDISVDPQFISSTDFRLLSISPCIDAGDPNTDGDGISWVTDTDDQDPDGTRIDMGALYYGQGPIVNADSTVAIPNFNCLSYNWSAGQTQSSIIVSPNQTTTYILTVNDGNSTFTDSVTVTVNPLPQPDLGPDIIQYCSQDNSLTNYNITLNLNPGSGYSNYQWMNIISHPEWDWLIDTTFLGSNPSYTFSGNAETITVLVTDSLGCIGSDNIVIQNIISGCLDSNNLVIGDNFEGGIIFYLDGNGSGLIASPTDQAGDPNYSGAYWGCSGTDVPGAQGIVIGTGKQNTIDIEAAGCGIAADLCANLTLNGYSDWFLPSLDELMKMYLNIGQGNIFDYGNIGAFGDNYYWSSSESNTAPADGAGLFAFNYGGGLNNYVKNYPTYVRAIREFKLPGYGCTDPLSFNYDPTATIDDNSCIATVFGCMDSTQVSYNILANTDNGSCYDCSITASAASSLPSSVTACNGSIFITPLSSSFPFTYTWSNGYTSNYNTSLCDGAYTYTVIDSNGCGFTETIVLTTHIGCTDPTALNYDPTAIVDNGFCIYGMTYVPDNNFESYLESNLMGDGIADNDSVLTANINTVTTLNVFNLQIADLTGIEDFTALTNLNCGWGNQLTSLDVSANTALTNLSCSGNQLTSLDVSANTALTNLDCAYNQLTSLDVSGATALTNLDCVNNQLTSLEVSGASALTLLYCGWNQLSVLNVSANTALTSLFCRGNQLTVLNVSANTALTNLECGDNQLTSLEVSGASALTSLFCRGNQLTVLNVSANTALTNLDCTYNQLTSLDVRNGTNTNLSYFYASYNPNLYCIDVDNPVWSSANWTVANGKIDPQSYFSNNCNPTYPLQVFLDGYYLLGSNPAAMTAARYDNLVASGSANPGANTDVDVITVELRSPSSLDVVAYSVSTILQTNGSAQCVFPAGALGGSYYIVVKHRAANPLWSANPILISYGSAYSFVDNEASSYTDGDSVYPSVHNLNPGLYGLWMGELNYDGYLDATDYTTYESNVILSSYGGLYLLNGDLNGDTYVDASDYTVFHYNSQQGVYTQRPYDIPTLLTVTTTAVSAITATSASSGGAVTSNGGAVLSAWGVCWSTSANPTLANSFLQNTVSSGSFSSALSGLLQNTTYYVRAYATNSAGTAYGNVVSFTTNTVLLIGQSYQGGKIAYILQVGDIGYDATMQHGLIAALSDQGGAWWGCSGTVISGADGTAIGTGNQNTIDIMTGCSTAGIAARVCGDLVLDGYSDWYLPSKDELNKLYINKVAIGGFAENPYYWSSTEAGFVISWNTSSWRTAWAQDFIVGSQGFNWRVPGNVRAVRSF